MANPTYQIRVEPELYARLREEHPENIREILRGALLQYIHEPPAMQTAIQKDQKEPIAIQVDDEARKRAIAKGWILK